ncbi:ACT domain-containing protein [Solirhodobacter olei]|uniref:ACT domain-containing protein n=1 Tax=Solirhodobacter olei TaxID=2493082 RepID=UPI000FDB4638|nr:ACT domain-containing protein [Solirhodobacter olei]
MSGETDLDRLLAGMEPILHPGTYAFATLGAGALPPTITPRMTFREAEGMTVILLRQDAEAAGIACGFPSRMITLNVHSALEAVGFLARITTALAAEGIGVNPVAAFYHDHLFVPEDRAEDALAILRRLAAGPG